MKARPITLVVQKQPNGDVHFAIRFDDCSERQFGPFSHWSIALLNATSTVLDLERTAR